MKKIRDFFKVQSNYQLFIINIVFALTGASSVFVADYILDIFLVNRIDYGDFLYWLTRIILMLPTYQILLIIFQYPFILFFLQDLKFFLDLLIVQHF